MSERTVDRLAAGRSYEGRGRYLTVRLSEGERVAVEVAARGAGVSVSEWVRGVLLRELEGARR